MFGLLHANLLLRWLRFSVQATWLWFTLFLMDYAVLLMRLSLSNCTFRETVGFLSNADGVNSLITVQLVVVIFQLRKLKIFFDMWTHKDRSMKQWNEFQNHGMWHVSVYWFVNAKYLCKHFVLYCTVHVGVGKCIRKNRKSGALRNTDLDGRIILKFTLKMLERVKYLILRRSSLNILAKRL
jgi:hypothetical protein